MVSQEQRQKAIQWAAGTMKNAGMMLREDEIQSMEVADFGLGQLESTGLQVVVYVNTDRVCAKELILSPRQNCPEHFHPAIGGQAGKEETFRCRWGKVWLYVPGEGVERPACKPPAGKEAFYTVWHEIELNPGDQYTLLPETRHWFQAGDEGAIVSEFSTRSRDEHDIFTDPEIVR